MRDARPPRAERDGDRAESSAPDDEMSTSLRQLASPQRAQVVTAPDGTPHAVVEAGRRRMVIDVREDWLVQDRWWTEAPVDRHYWELVLQPGRLVVIYRDTRSNRWFTHSM